MPNPLVHFEINGSDQETSAKFYSELFGWKTQSMPEMNYVMLDTFSGKGLNGGFAKIDKGNPHVIIYVGVEDLEATLTKAKSLGGKVAVPVTEIPNMGHFAQFTDPEGNLVGLFKAAGQTGPGVSAGDNPPVGWFEILGKDGAALQKFYADLFDWEVKPMEAPGMVYAEVIPEAGTSIPGGIGTGPGGMPNLTVYVEVSDLNKYLDKAVALGGEKAVEPMEVGGGTSVAAFKDNEGRVFGLYKNKS